MMDVFVEGTTVVKKNNFQKHVERAVHIRGVQGLACVNDEVTMATRLQPTMLHYCKMIKGNFIVLTFYNFVICLHFLQSMSRI
jgi:hypothetical protein